MCSKYWIQHKRTIYVSYAYDSNGFSVKILSLCHFILLNAFQLSKNLLKRSWWQMDSVELFIFINLNINPIIIIRNANFIQWIYFFCNEIYLKRSKICFDLWMLQTVWTVISIYIDTWRSNDEENCCDQLIVFQTSLTTSV